MNKEVTCILTSCGRFDLLRITLESFFKHNTYDVKNFIVFDDSELDLSELIEEYPLIEWHGQTKRSGQIDALDFLWSLVYTPYAFTLEDDWEFLQPGFIEASMEVLEMCPQVLQCWLQIEDTNKHPVYLGNYAGPVSNPVEFGIMKSEPNIWGGTRFNPALKRKSDYDLIAPFSKHTNWDASKPWKSEADISKVYHKLGFKGAVLQVQYIRHIGDGRHVGV